MKTELILLAAGQSKRFGGIKQLTNIHGQPMICHCLSQYLQGSSWLNGIDNGLVILGANAGVITAVLPKNINKHVIKTWQNGMGHTLAKSMQYIAKDTSHVFIGLADQVLISHSIIENMLKQSKKNPDQIIAASYADKLGAPAIFPKPYFPQLTQLTGDKGAKQIMQQSLHEIVSIEMPEAAVDIDRPADLKFV